MLNKQPLRLGEVYFSQPEMINQILQSAEQPYMIDYQMPKILPFATGWDNLLLPSKQVIPALKQLIKQHLKQVRDRLGTELTVVDQFWIQLIRGLASQHQLIVINHFLDELPPNDARQLLKDVKQVAAKWQIVIIITTNQEAIFNNFRAQVLN
ncbi:hypothetical protein [Latilactobacillus graminis]|uniref:Uncharacterized protein n=2 Tax=Latilactobacillus graminis TaxID=60519 RepID=A0AA89KXC7_9LACO|nr:hypothetical protein [Latilactobacillus graminis]KRM22431.1 hypothetical protein FC90_GL001034 [Latilactobacillus graminis DSM 20719]